MKFALTPKEQTNVRAALAFLRRRCGGWVQVGQVLRLSDVTLRQIARGGTATVNVAFRVARLAHVGVDDVLEGRFPAPGTCPCCGHIESTPSNDAS